MGRLSRLFARCSRIEKFVLICNNDKDTFAIRDAMGDVHVEELVMEQLGTLEEHSV